MITTIVELINVPVLYLSSYLYACIVFAKNLVFGLLYFRIFIFFSVDSLVILQIPVEF